MVYRYQDQKLSCPSGYPYFDLERGVFRPWRTKLAIERKMSFLSTVETEPLNQMTSFLLLKQNCGT